MSRKKKTQATTPPTEPQKADRPEYKSIKLVIKGKPKTLPGPLQFITKREKVVIDTNMGPVTAYREICLIVDGNGKQHKGLAGEFGHENPRKLKQAIIKATK